MSALTLKVAVNLAGQALYERLGYVRDEVYLTYWLSLTNT